MRNHNNSNSNTNSNSLYFVLYLKIYILLQMDFRTRCVQCGNEHHKRRRRSPADRGYYSFLPLILDLLFGKPVQLDLGSIIENDIHNKKGSHNRPSL